MTSKTLNLDQLNQEIKTFVDERDWEQFHSVKNLSMALAVEASELGEIFQWMKEEESNSAHLQAEIKTKIEDEVADVFIYLMRILSKTNIDLELAIRNKMEKNRKKYPAHLVKGNSKKYDEY
jgi:dCTP diphosphatase